MPPLPPHQHLPRIITYYQTHHDSNGNHISVLPLLTQPNIGLTHLILAAIHINEDPNALTLNDHSPHHERFTTLWAEMRVLQASGVKVLGMLGGAAKGSFTRLSPDNPQTFESYYAPLASLVRLHSLDGLDLDVEEPIPLSSIIHLIDRLRTDFGPEFIITLAPVAAALLSPEHNLSGFDYEALEVLRGKEIAWYNAQFYCGWGDCSNPLMYEMVLRKGWKAERVVVGMVTNPENGSGWVPWHILGGVLPLLVGKHPGFGGVMGWEYFNSLPGGKERPWEWAEWMTALLRGSASGRAVDRPGGGDAVVEVKKGGDAVSDEKRGFEVDPDDGDTTEEPVPVPKSFVYDTDEEE